MTIMNFLKTITILTALFMGLVSYAADTVTVHITDGIDDGSVKTQMELTLSNLLTEANAAHEQKREMRSSAIGLPDTVQGPLGALWRCSPFVSPNSEIVEHCLTTGTGYQVRNIPLILKSFDSDNVAGDEDYQEAVASFDKQGNLTSFYLSISRNLYTNIVNDSQDSIDLRRRQRILDYVEHFRTAYNQKDRNFLESVFSDAWIYNGKVPVQKPMHGGSRSNKIKYLDSLSRVLGGCKQISVTFDEIEVMRHDTYADTYGVTLHHGYQTEYYQDSGYLFLLWVFSDEDNPQIDFRAWQPDSSNQRIPKDELITLSDLDINR